MPPEPTLSEGRRLAVARRAAGHTVQNSPPHTQTTAADLLSGFVAQLALFPQEEAFFHQPHGQEGREDSPSVTQGLGLSPGAEMRGGGQRDQTWPTRTPPRVTLGPVPTHLWQPGNGPCTTKELNSGLCSLLHPGDMIHSH